MLKQTSLSPLIRALERTERASDTLRSTSHTSWDPMPSGHSLFL